MITMVINQLITNYPYKGVLITIRNISSVWWTNDLCEFYPHPIPRFSSEKALDLTLQGTNLHDVAIARLNKCRSAGLISPEKDRKVSRFPIFWDLDLLFMTFLGICLILSGGTFKKNTLVFGHSVGWFSPWRWGFHPTKMGYERWKLRILHPFHGCFMALFAVPVVLQGWTNPMCGKPATWGCRVWLQLGNLMSPITVLHWSTGDYLSRDWRDSLAMHHMHLHLVKCSHGFWHVGLGICFLYGYGSKLKPYGTTDFSNFLV